MKKLRTVTIAMAITLVLLSVGGTIYATGWGGRLSATALSAIEPGRCTGGRWRCTSPPYPHSTAILDITWNFDNKVRAGQGSDLWPTTWAANDDLYAAWGDGGGTRGSNAVCRTRFGLNTLTGSPPNFTFNELWGCKADGTGCDAGATHHAACDAPFGGPVAASGVPDALIAIGNTLYVLLGAIGGGPRIASSTDLGQSWTNFSWQFTGNTGDFLPGSFVHFGAGYAGARDTFLYTVGGKVGDTTRTYLARVLTASISAQGNWEYFTGTAGSPTWGTWANATAIHLDPNATGDGTATGGKMQYFPMLGRYIFTHLAGQIRQMHVYDAPEPWGPWTTVYYSDHWGWYGTTGALWFNIIPKFISADNTTFWMTFSGFATPVNWDSYNLIQGTFTLP